MAAMCLPTVPSLMYSWPANGGVGASLRHELEHVAFARAQQGRGMQGRGAAEQLGDHLGVHRGAAGRDAPQRLDEVGGVEHAVLEQVADSARAVGEQLAGVDLLDVLRQHEHREPGPAAAGLDRGTHALILVAGRQAYVHG